MPIRFLILKIVGDGPERQVLEEQLNRYPAEVGQSVKWLGAIPNSQIPEVLSTFHIAVAPYPDIPGFYFSPLKVLEYMAGGLPVIASRIGQIPSLVRHNQHGLLVKPGCERELKQSISYLCSDQDLRTRLGRTAQKYVQDNHTWHHVVDRVLTSLPASVAACEAC